MSTLLFANDAKSTLAGPLTQSATTLQVVAGGGALFPEPVGGQYFVCTLISAADGNVKEIIHVTAVSADTFTVVRAQEATDNLPWGAGDFISCQPTAGQMAAFAQLTDLSSSFFQGQDTSGTANTPLVTNTNPSNAGPTQNQAFLIQKGPLANTGNITIKIPNTGQYEPLLNADGSQVAPGGWPGNAYALMIFNGTIYQLSAVLVPPPGKNGIQYLNSYYQLDYPDMTALGTLNAADLLAICASETEGGQPPGHYKATLGLLGAFIAAYLAANPTAGVLSNVQIYRNSTRVAMSAGAGTVVKPWTGIIYPKTSNTSRLLVLGFVISGYNETAFGGPGTSSVVQIDIGTQTTQTLTAANVRSATDSAGGASPVIDILSGLPQANLPVDVGYSNPSSGWNESFNPNNVSDVSYFPPSTQSIIILAELGP